MGETRYWSMKLVNEKATLRYGGRVIVEVPGSLYFALGPLVDLLNVMFPSSRSVRVTDRLFALERVVRHCFGPGRALYVPKDNPHQVLLPASEVNEIADELWILDQVRSDEVVDRPELVEAVMKDAALPAPVTIDPWAHRSAKMRCSTCMWYVTKDSNGKETMVGRCRRHAPTMSGYPVVFATDWCGDHKLDEAKA